jgi:hypothetical protein
MRIAFDIGGVLSKYPGVFGPLLDVLHYHGNSQGVEVWIISDMHPEQKIIDMLELNGIAFLKHRVRSADYQTHGEMCKAVLCKELGIDLLVDDFPGYVAAGEHVRLLVMPNPTEPYYHDEWKTDGSEGAFGRRLRRPTKGDHPWQ